MRGHREGSFFWRLIWHLNLVISLWKRGSSHKYLLHTISLLLQSKDFFFFFVLFFGSTLRFALESPAPRFYMCNKMDTPQMNTSPKPNALAWLPCTLHGWYVPVALLLVLVRSTTR